MIRFSAWKKFNLENFRIFDEILISEKNIICLASQPYRLFR